MSSHRHRNYDRHTNRTKRSCNSTSCHCLLVSILILKWIMCSKVDNGPQRAPAIIWKTLGGSTGSLSESKKLRLGKGERRGQTAFQGTGSCEGDKRFLMENLQICRNPSHVAVERKTASGGLVPWWLKARAPLSSFLVSPALCLVAWGPGQVIGVSVSGVLTRTAGPMLPRAFVAVGQGLTRRVWRRLLSCSVLSSSETRCR